ncbi:MAG: hypothetical protein ACD_79C01304G0003 [uncultured bacterium]|nr:MAG: hypothetical protein ACD_79C01304G0003 [uncultured bacterium]
MPLPVAHSIAGYILQDTRKFSFLAKEWNNLLFLVLVSNIPDIDFLPGLLIGAPNLFHHGISHSLGFSLFFGFLISFFVPHNNKSKYFTNALLLSLVCYSHVILDYFTTDERPPYGVMLFWPFDSTYYIAAQTIFIKALRSESSFDFFQSLVNENNFRAIVREILIMGIFVALTKFAKKLFK